MRRLEARRPAMARSPGCPTRQRTDSATGTLPAAERQGDSDGRGEQPTYKLVHWRGAGILFGCERAEIGKSR